MIITLGDALKELMKEIKQKMEQTKGEKPWKNQHS